MKWAEPDVDVPPVPEEPPAVGECHLWHVPVRRRDDWLELLTSAERSQAERFVVDHARDTFVTSRAAQRLVGSHYLDCRPRSLFIDRDCGYCGAGHGRPRFAGAGIDYSVTHTDEWLALAVVAHGRVGIDAESRHAVRKIDELARVALMPVEWSQFASIPSAERARWFLTAWTRKEAAMKVTGLGLRAPPNQLDVRGATLAVGAVPGWPEGVIYLCQAPAPAGHEAALASTVPLTTISVHHGAAIDRIGAVEYV